MDNKYILLLILIIPVLFYIIVNYLYNKYKNINNKNKKSGFEIAREVFDNSGMKETYIVLIRTGDLTDCFDLKQSVLRLSSNVYYESSIYSITMSLYYSTFGLLSRDEKSVYYIKGKLDVLFDFFYYILGIVLLMWVFTMDNNILLVSIGLFSCILLYELFTIPVCFNIVKKMIEIGLEQNLIDKEEVLEINKVGKVIAFSYLARAIVLLNKAYKELIDMVKRG